MDDGQTRGEVDGQLREIELPVVRHGEGDAVVMKVSNAGVPIPSDALQTIFEPLVQAPNASSEAHERSKTSLGLGLFIVREIVLAHGGTISAASIETGTVFTIRLPRTTG